MSVSFRLVLKKVEMTMLDNGNCHFVVWLSSRGEIFTGEAVCPDNEEQQLTAVVQATLQAVVRAISKPIEMKLVYGKQIFLSEIGKVIYLVVIQTGKGSQVQQLPGICLFTATTPEVAVRATLSALNRTIAKLA